jgi:phosphate transport system protein
MTDKHLSSQFDSELQGVSARVMEMGGLVEAQLRLTLAALAAFDQTTLIEVKEHEDAIDSLEVTIDREIADIIARRQPTARDLRLLMAISKITTNLERAGDETEKMARMITKIVEAGVPRALPFASLRTASELAQSLVRRALDAFARLDTQAALVIMREDDLIDREFDAFVRRLVDYMVDDPRAISASLDLLFLAKAIERVGDHAKNIAEFVIHVVKGEDVRHSVMKAT